MTVFADDELKNSSSGGISLSNLFELLDPIASSVASVYVTNNYLARAKKKLKTFDPSDKRVHLDEWKLKLLQRVKALDKPLHTVLFKEDSRLGKLFYPFTLFTIFCIGFVMGKFPEWFHVLYTFLFFLLMPLRFYTYYKTNNHYYLADLCYFVNFLCLLFIWCFPDSVHLYQTCFAFTFGSLSFAVITWRNSLVIHSLDKTTSCFIHIMPTCTMYIIHHGISEELKSIRFPAASIIASKSWNLKKNIIWTSLYYLVWQSLYHYFITLRKSSKIKSGERMTSFEYLTTHQYKNFWVVKLPQPWPMIVYTIAQYFYQLATMLLCGIWFNYRIAAIVFLTFIFLCAAHNGATYYIDYYGKRFEKEVEKLRNEVENLQQQLKSSGTNSALDNCSMTSGYSIIDTAESSDRSSVNSKND